MRVLGALAPSPADTASDTIPDLVDVPVDTTADADACDGGCMEPLLCCGGRCVNTDHDPRQGSGGLKYFQELPALAEKRTSPAWLSRDMAKMMGAVSRMPDRPEIEGTLNEQLIVEYYSRR